MGCIPWGGLLTHDGYPRQYARAGTQYAHRQRWIAKNGPIPAGMELDHLCRNRSCVNVDHLELVTHAENMRRARKATCVRGHELVEKTRPNGQMFRHCMVCDRAYHAAAWRGEPWK
jgi:hypothetical protein